VKGTSSLASKVAASFVASPYIFLGRVAMEVVVTLDPEGEE